MAITTVNSVRRTKLSIRKERTTVVGTIRHEQDDPVGEQGHAHELLGFPAIVHQNTSKRLFEAQAQSLAAPSRTAPLIAPAVAELRASQARSAQAAPPGWQRRSCVRRLTCQAFDDQDVASPRFGAPRRHHVWTTSLKADGTTCACGSGYTKCGTPVREGTVLPQLSCRVFPT